MTGLSPVAVVLLSGGMDSAACAMWASQEYDDLLALSVSYGQPHRDAEIYAAGTLAKNFGLEWVRIHAGNMLPPAHAMAESPVVPGRNATLLAMAAGHAAAKWPGRSVDIIIGSCKDDFAVFHDCRAAFFDAMTAALTLSAGVAVRVVAPLCNVSKVELVAQARLDPPLMAAIKSSFSCYRGTACGTCAACRSRRMAFESMGVIDRQHVPTMTGGDPSREHK